MGKDQENSASDLPSGQAKDAPHKQPHTVRESYVLLGKHLLQTLTKDKSKVLLTPQDEANTYLVGNVSRAVAGAVSTITSALQVVLGVWSYGRAAREGVGNPAKIHDAIIRGESGVNHSLKDTASALAEFVTVPYNALSRTIAGKPLDRTEEEFNKKNQELNDRLYYTKFSKNTKEVIYARVTLEQAKNNSYDSAHVSYTTNRPVLYSCPATEENKKAYELGYFRNIEGSRKVTRRDREFLQASSKVSAAMHIGAVASAPEKAINNI